MTRLEVLSGNSRSDSAELAKLHRGVRQYDKDMRRFGGIVHRMGFSNPANELTDAQLSHIVGRTLGKSVESKGIFSRKTELILKAACAQYLGHYPTQTPSKSEIKTILTEMARMHGRSWKEGIECMEPWFNGTQKAMREIQKYAARNGILPGSPQ
ncbi:MAG: hypothetical protein NTY83_01070 [Candidatus Micrarchaeota archaeon]|nr:hypothetical protein [Candidatus Micrarchaeota archaeon]